MQRFQKIQNLQRLLPFTEEELQEFKRIRKELNSDTAISKEAKSVTGDIKGNN